MLLDQLIKAATLFGLGMGTVFVLLTLLISCVSLLSFLCGRYFSHSDSVQAAQAPVASREKTSVLNQNISALEISIVKAAVKAHRQASV